MATSTTSATAPYVPANAIALWADWISQSFQSFGWVKTADTGQCTPSALVSPSTTMTPAGYELFRMADALQATAPVFVKIEYGTANNISYPGIWLTVGTGTNKAGNLTGVLYARGILALSANSVTTQACYASGDAGRAAFALWPVTSSTYSLFFAIERTHTANGELTGDGVLVFAKSSVIEYSAYCPFVGTLPSRQAVWNVAVPPVGSGALAPNTHAYPVRCWAPGETYPAFNIVGYVSGDFGTLATYLVACHDNNHRTYLMLGPNARTVGLGGVGHIGMRYD